MHSFPRSFLFLLSPCLLLGCGLQQNDVDRDGFTLSGGDCDDTDDSIHPGAQEHCDGVDSNCDGVVDEDDEDGDGVAACSGDCDDADSLVLPGAVDVCDGLDNDCDGTVDNDYDTDGDGHSSCSGDCDDGNPNRAPDVVEVCNGLDDNCDGVVDEGFDGDGDGYTTCSVPLADCDDSDPAVYPGAVELCDELDHDCDGLPGASDDDLDGVAVCAGDCDDTDPSVHADAPELCDGLDNDCDGETDEDYDVDGDGVSSCGGDCDDGDAQIHPDAQQECGAEDTDCDGVPGDLDLDGDGSPSCEDCDDSDPERFSGAMEQCDGLDTDCNGLLLDWEQDSDNDGYVGCEPFEGVTTDTLLGGGDCDDAEALAHPGGVELCDGIDNNCSGAVDEPYDQDGDGFSTCGADGLVGTEDDDCDDTVATGAAAAPGNMELCDGIDNNCDGLFDDSADEDGDGFTVCGADGTDGTSDDDCNDAPGVGALVFPGNPEICDGLDNDCSGVVDDAADLDGDGQTACSGDCDDAEASVWTGADEVCDGVDNNCDGTIDESPDADGDGYSVCDGDCDDDDPSVFPNVTFETCDAIASDCGGSEPYQVVVAFLPGQVGSWSNLAGLVSAEFQSQDGDACELAFVDVPAPVTEAALVASGAHVAMISSPGESCVVYDTAARAELVSWLNGAGEGLLLTGTLGDDTCAGSTYNDRYELATLVGVTPHFSEVSTTVPAEVSEYLGTGSGASSIWEDLPSAWTSDGDAVGDDVMARCQPSYVPGQVGDTSLGADQPRQIVAYEANPALPCLTGVPMSHKGVWLPLQPEEGGNQDDLQLLINAIEWLMNP